MANFAEFAGVFAPGVYVPDLRYGAVLTGVPLVVAAAGRTQGTATALSSTVSQVTNGSGTNGVILPLPEVVQGGRVRFVINKGASAVLVYPPTGGSINNGTVNAGLSVAANTMKGFYDADGAGNVWTF